MHYDREQLISFCREDLRPVRSIRKVIFKLGLWLPAGARRSRRTVSPVFNTRHDRRSNVNKTEGKQTWPPIAEKQRNDTGIAGLKIGWLNVQSLRNKTTAIHEIVEERDLDAAILTETRHGSSDDVSLRLADPTGFSAVSAVQKADPNHGGIVVFHRSRYRCARLPLPELTSFEGLCVRLYVGGESVTLLLIYRPGSCRPSTVFYEELRMVLEMLVLQPGPIILGGDVNIHVERPDDSDSIHFSEMIESFNMIQHVVGPTHLYGGTLDLISTFSDTPLSQIVVDPAGMISDHSLVTAFLTVHHQADPVRSRKVRSWKKVDLSVFREAIRESALTNPSPLSSSSELFAVYDTCLLLNTRRVPRSAKLWKSMAKILRCDTNQGTPPPSVLTADGFLKFFSDTVESVRGATMGHPLPRILPTAVTSLSQFRACTEDEVREVIMRPPSKSCNLDPIPTTILEECIDDLLPFLTAMCNASLLEGHLPVSQRHAIITPLIKILHLDAAEMKKNRPVSNLTFVSKVVERLVSGRLVG